jgi:lipase
VHPKAFSISGHQGVSLNAWDYGGDGPPLLLLHCTGTHGRIWDPLVEHFLPSFRVFSLDTRGHGDSAKPAEREAYAWIHSGRDVLAVADALGFGSGLRVAGHSAGGAHAAYAAWLRPGVFARMALIDPVIGPASFFAGERPLAQKARQRRDTF